MVTSRIAALSLSALVVGASTIASGCGSPPCGLRACDIRDSDCQRIIAAATACLREVPAVMVPVQVMSREEYIHQKGDAPLTPEEEAQFRTVNAGLALFGLAPKDQSPADLAAANASWVGAFYSSDTKSITILDNGHPLDSIYFTSMLAHEYQHAIQDARYGIQATYQAHGDDSNSNLAVGAMIEGEASVVGDRALVHLFGDSPGDIPWSRVFDKWQSDNRKKGLASANPVTLAYSTFAYAFGTPYLHQAIGATGWSGADTIFAAPPSGERQIMTGFAADEPGGGPWAEDLGDQAVPVLPARFSFQGADQLGAWIVSLLLGRLGLQSAEDPAKSLTGDVLSFFRDETTGTVVAAWRLRFSSPGAAQDAVDTFFVAGRLPDWAPLVQWFDRDVFLMAAADPSSFDVIPQPLTFQAVPPRAEQSMLLRQASAGSGEIRCALTERP
jgi:hypothetical protein